MKKTAFLCSLALVSCLSAENLFDNSTMDTAGGWKGSRKFVVEEKDNRVLSVEAKKRGPVSFSQKVPLRGLTDLVLKFRYRTANYNGRGFELKGTRPDDTWTFVNRAVETDGQWHEMEWTYTQVKGSNSIDFEISVLEGEGEIFFDDVTVESAK